MTIKELFDEIKENGNCLDFDNFYQVWFEEDVDDVDVNDEDDIRSVEIGWHNYMMDEVEDYYETLGDFFDEGNWEDK